MQYLKKPNRNMSEIKDGNLTEAEEIEALNKDADEFGDEMQKELDEMPEVDPDVSDTDPAPAVGDNAVQSNVESLERIGDPQMFEEELNRRAKQSNDNFDAAAVDDNALMEEVGQVVNMEAEEVRENSVLISAYEASIERLEGEKKPGAELLKRKMMELQNRNDALEAKSEIAKKFLESMMRDTRVEVPTEVLQEKEVRDQMAQIFGNTAAYDKLVEKIQGYYEKHMDKLIKSRGGQKGSEAMKRAMHAQAFEEAAEGVSAILESVKISAHIPKEQHQQVAQLLLSSLER